MHDDPRSKWDARYETARRDEVGPCAVLRAYRHLLPVRGKALDLACGLGGNALFLAEQGLEVSAWDISGIAIERLTEWADEKRLVIDARCVDVVSDPPRAETFDVIVVSRFLERTLVPDIVAALKPAGLLYYQTFTRAGTGPHGPTNPEYRLAPNELLHLFVPPLELVAYREEGSIGDMNQGLRGEAWLVARRGR